MAAPSVRAFNTATFSDSQVWAAPLPATVFAGDELWVGFHIRQTSSTPVADGWEVVSDGVTAANVMSSTVANRQVWLRKTGGADGSEGGTSVNFTLDSANADGSTTSLAIQGHDPAAPVGLVYAVTDEDGGLTYVSPASIVTPRDDCLVLHGYAAASNSNNSAFSWTHSTASEITDVRANNRQTMTVASATQASAGAITENVGTADVAGSTVTWGTVVVLVVQPPEDDEPEPVAVTTGAGALSLAAQATTVTLGGITLQTGAAELTIAAQAPSITLGELTRTTGAATLSVNPGTSGVTLGELTLSTGAAVLTLGAQPVTLSSGLRVATGAAGLTLAAQPTSVTQGALSLTTGAATLALVARGPSVDTGADEPDPFRPNRATRSLATSEKTISIGPNRATISIGAAA